MRVRLRPSRAATAQKLVTPEHITVLNPSERMRSRI